MTLLISTNHKGRIENKMAKPGFYQFVLLIWLFLITVGLRAQLPQNPIGSNPPTLNWQQINTDQVRLIYPESLDSTAWRVSNIIHFLWDEDDQRKNVQNKKLPILLHGLRVSPNGFVIVGPFRSEFYTIPPQFKSLTSWIDNLTIHEYEHVRQFSNADRGLSGLTKDIFGSWIWGGMFALALPRWYYEGDAVVSETNLTKAGRGRFPAFNMEYHALLHEGIRYDYEKASAGSLQEFVPNWYKQGYHMVEFARKKFGPNIWDDVESDALAYKGIFYPFSKSLKNHVGWDVKQLYHHTIENLTEEWKLRDAGNSFQSEILNTTEKPTVINYNAPVTTLDNEIIAIKSGYNQWYELVKIKADGSEVKLTDIGILPDRQLSTLSISNNFLVWAEQGFHPRWQNETFNDIVLYNLINGEKIKLTKRDRYFSPAINAQGTRIAAIHIDRSLCHQLRIIALSNRQVISEVSYPFYSELSFPVWISDHQVAFIHTRDQYNEIRIWDTNAESDSVLSGWISHHISHLTFDPESNQLLFSMEEGLVNNIYALSLASGEINQITDDVIGAYQPCVAKDHIYYATFSSQGYNLRKNLITKIKKFTPQHSAPHNQRLISLHSSENIVGEIKLNEYPSSGFSRWSGLVNFHSIIPEWTPPEVKLSLLSDNAFGTMSGTIDLSYNYNENEFKYGGGIRYAEWYPIISVSFTKANRNAISYQFTGLTDTTFVQAVTVDQWRENRIRLGMTLPYNFSGGSMLRSVSLTTNYEYRQIRLDDEPFRDLSRDTIEVGRQGISSLSEVFNDPLKDLNIHNLDLSFVLNIRKIRALQHLRPRLGWSLLLRYRNHLRQENPGGNNFLARSFIYLPGWSKNHSLSFDVMYMQEDILSRYRFSDVFVYPRGYDSSLRRDKFFKLGINYRFPMWYPDKAIEGLAFIKRLKGNIFFDYGRFTVDSFPFESRSVNSNSVGFELGMDFRALRLLEIDLGVRYGYLLNKDLAPGGNQHQFDFFVVSVSE